jgi:nitrite reductase (NADH) small subunit
VTVVGRVSDFPEGTHRVVSVDGREVGVFNIGGRLYGLLSRCAHQGGPLCTAQRTTGTLVADAESGWRPRWALDGEIVACPWHGLEYHVPTGRCLAFPEIVLRRYDVVVDGEDVVVSPAPSRRPPAVSGP